MKKNLVLRIGALALAGCCITMTMLSGTFAKYTSSVTGSAQATVAAWSFKVNGVDKTIMTPFDLKDSTIKSGSQKEGVIAPGTSGQIDLKLDGTGSEVTIGYVIKLDKSGSTDIPANLVFKDASGNALTWTNDVATLDADGTIIYGEGADAMKKDVVVKWEWPYETAGEGKDALDVNAAGKNWTIGITVEATQKIEKNDTPAS